MRTATQQGRVCLSEDTGCWALHHHMHMHTFVFHMQIMRCKVGAGTARAFLAVPQQPAAALHAGRPCCPSPLAMLLSLPPQPPATHSSRCCRRWRLSRSTQCRPGRSGPGCTRCCRTCSGPAAGTRSLSRCCLRGSRSLRNSSGGSSMAGLELAGVAVALLHLTQFGPRTVAGFSTGHLTVKQSQ